MGRFSIGGGGSTIEIDARDFGAVGDGDAILDAISAAEGEGGGMVAIATGTWDMPAAESILPALVSLKGTGRGIARLHWGTTAGADAWGLSYDDSSPDTYQLNSIRDLYFTGPGYGAPLVYGTAPSNMHGLRVGRRTSVDNVAIGGFKIGLGIDRDHNDFRSLTCSGNHYNVGITAGTAVGAGNHNFWSCQLDSCTYASVLVEATARLEGSEFIGCHFGIGPYCFYTPSGRTNNSFMLGVRFFDCAFELFGNAIFQSDDTSAGWMKYVTLYDPNSSQDNAKCLPATTFDHYADVARMQSCYILTDNGFLSATPGVSYFRVRDGTGWADSHIDADLSSQSIPFVTGAVTSGTWAYRNTCRGPIVNAFSAVTAGQLCRWAFDSNNTVVPWDGSGAIAGWAMDSGSGGAKVRLQRGPIVTGVLIDTVAGNIITGDPLMPSSANNGQLMKATNWSDQVVAVAQNATSTDGGAIQVDSRLPW